MKARIVLSWLLQLTAAIILLQTLYFKFTAHEESVYIFTTVGMEPWGRIGSGVAELVAGALLLLPRTVVHGALLAAMIMVGAIASHLFVLGIVVKDDGGQLFIMACVVFFSSVGLLYLHRDELSMWKAKLLSRDSS
ncbi:MAG TPA: DoxX family protein [Ohtaekwangia sp.]|nr:DoxX family protein [Ohtaekwangia sp.]